MKKKQFATFSGVGIHSGRVANVRVRLSDKPGIVFRRTDLAGAAPIPATWDNVSNTGLMSTSIGKGANRVDTIEHFMAALFVCGIDSAVIDIDGPEFPIMDGGTKQFMEIFAAAGFCKPWRGAKIIVKMPVIARRQEIIKRMPVWKRVALFLHNLRTGRREDGFVQLSPCKKGLHIKATLVYPDKIIGTQSAEFLFGPSPQSGAEAGPSPKGAADSRQRFMREFADSRTFGRIWEWDYLKKRGMGLGANENNVIALNETGDGTLNKLHRPDEFARHKLVDAVGDMFASGGMIIGELESYKGSHALNNLALRKLFADPENYDIIDANNK